FIFLDEISKAGKLRYLDQLLLQGRSKGVPVWLGTQSISSLQATYGKEVANDLLAGCGNVAVLALADAESARWAEETFGRQERWVNCLGYSSTCTEKGGSTTRSSNWSLSIKPTVLASEFLSIRPPNKHTNEPLAGYFRVPGAGQFRAEIALDKLRAELPDTTAR